MSIHTLQQFWQQHALTYYQSLAEREQRLVLFAVMTVPLMILIFGILLPINDDLHAKQKSLMTLQHQVQKAESLANTILQQGVKEAHGSIMTVVDQQARVQKVRPFITSLRPQLGGDKPRLWIKMQQAPYLSSVHFYQALAKQNIQIIQIKWQKTQQAGVVNIQAVVQ
jgi:type II secretory pathway component PulM